MNRALTRHPCKNFNRRTKVKGLPDSMYLFPCIAFNHFALLIANSLREALASLVVVLLILSLLHLFQNSLDILHDICMSVFILPYYNRV